MPEWFEKLPYAGDAYGLAGQLGDGLHHCGVLCGWLDVEIRDDESRLVTWTSNKGHHHLLHWNPAVSVVFRADVIGLVLRSIRSMRPVWGEADRIEVAAWLEDKIERAVIRRKSKQRRA